MDAPRRSLDVDRAVLLEALVARDEGLLATYLDLTSGSWLREYDPAVTGRDNEALQAAIDAEPERFAEVPRYSRLYRLMAQYVDTVEDDDLARLLDTALGGREAFRSFEAVLVSWPAEHASWEAYRRRALLSWGVAWLRGLGVEPGWDEALGAPPTGVPLLLRVALAGGALSCKTEAEASAAFLRLARQLCELRCEPFRARTVRGRTRFQRGGVALNREGTTVHLLMQQ